MSGSDRSKPVLVTGGAGFIGSHVVKHLLARGYSVVALDDLSGGFRDNVPAEARFVEGTILDEALLESLFEEHRFGAVFHLAAYAAEGLSPFIRKFNYTNNLIGSTNLINRSIRYRVKRVVFTSSIAVYGTNQLPMKEDLIPQPEDPYGIAKYAVELDLKSAHELFGLEYTIFRPHNVFGENQNIGDRYRNVIGIFMNQIMHGESLTIFGDGEQTRAFSYIDDVAVPMVDCLEVPKTIGEIYNIGADQPFSVNHLAKTVMKSMGKEVKLNYLPARNEVLHAYADHSKVQDALPLKRSVSFEDGIERMSKWALKHGPRKTSRFANIEISEKLPSAWT